MWLVVFGSLEAPVCSGSARLDGYGVQVFCAFKVDDSIDEGLAEFDI